MKRFWNVLLVVLALDFVGLCGFVGWLYQSGRLDRQKALAIREVVFPTTQPAMHATTQPTAPADPATQPTLRLEELLAQQTGHSASEQVEFIQHAFDTQMAQLDRRWRELNDLKRRADQDHEQLQLERTALEAERKKLEDDKQLAAGLEKDKGFQDSLKLYTAMPARQAKDIFLSLDDETVVRYLQAMEPRTAAKIVKEYKKPEERLRAQKVLERMRLAEASSKE